MVLKCCIILSRYTYRFESNGEEGGMMMHTAFFKRICSVICVTVVLASMLPAGVFTVHAEEAAEQSQTEITIPEEPEDTSETDSGPALAEESEPVLPGPSESLESPDSVGTPEPAQQPVQEGQEARTYTDDELAQMLIEYEEGTLSLLNQAALGEAMAGDTATMSLQDGYAGIGSDNAPFLVGTPDVLNELATLVNSDATFGAGLKYADASYQMIDDIDLAGYNKWTAIGDKNDTYDSVFHGHFDGGYHTISNLNVNYSHGLYMGLFGFISGATLENLGVVSAGTFLGSYVGVIASFVKDGSSISRCYSTCDTNGSRSVGGIAAYLRDSTMTDCYTTGYTVSAYTNADAGGLAGFIRDSVLTRCYATGSVRAYSSEDAGSAMAGGITSAYGNSRIVNCVYLGQSVSSNDNPVGRVAHLEDNATVTGSYGWTGTTLSDDAFTPGSDTKDGADFVYDSNTGLV